MQNLIADVASSNQLATLLRNNLPGGRPIWMFERYLNYYTSGFPAESCKSFC